MQVAATQQFARLADKFKTNAFLPALSRMRLRSFRNVRAIYYLKSNTLQVSVVTLGAKQLKKRLRQLQESEITTNVICLPK